MGFDREKFFKRLKTDYMGRSFKSFKNIDSTNLKASKILNKNDIVDGAILLAIKQHGGVGRFGREWLSPEGGLWFTLLLNAGTIKKDIEKINLVMANSIIRAIEKTMKEKFMVKWPNDIYLNGLKLGGILSEYIPKKIKPALIIGVGLNINNARNTLGKYKDIATTLFAETKKKFDIESILADILNCFEKDFEYFIKTGDLEKTIRYIKDRFLL
jgi:BirA family biotin operon repressor/biotin-[acetyl-CoA-carboxylase] ligase